MKNNIKSMRTEIRINYNDQYTTNNTKLIRTEICIDESEQSTINDIIVESIKKHIEKNEKINTNCAIGFENICKSSTLLLCVNRKYIKVLLSEIKKAFSCSSIKFFDLCGDIDIDIDGHLLKIGYISEDKKDLTRFFSNEYSFIISNFAENLVSEDDLDFIFYRLKPRGHEIVTEELIFNS